MAAFQRQAVDRTGRRELCRQSRRYQRGRRQLRRLRVGAVGGNPEYFPRRGVELAGSRGRRDDLHRHRRPDHRLGPDLDLHRRHGSDRLHAAVERGRLGVRSGGHDLHGRVRIAVGLRGRRHDLLQFHRAHHCAGHHPDRGCRFAWPTTSTGGGIYVPPGIITSTVTNGPSATGKLRHYLRWTALGNSCAVTAS
jgi:hypothetical protein